MSKFMRSFCFANSLRHNDLVLYSISYGITVQRKAYTLRLIERMRPLAYNLHHIASIGGVISSDGGSGSSNNNLLVFWFTIILIFAIIIIWKSAAQWLT